MIDEDLEDMEDSEQDEEAELFASLEESLTIRAFTGRSSQKLTTLKHSYLFILR